MSKQIDELFSPERLRKNWEKARSKKPDDNPEQKNKNTPISAFDALAVSLQERFYGENLAVLNLLLDSLYPVWELLFAEDAAKNNPEMGAAEMISLAHELLNQIEDLSFAFSLNKSAKQS
ncbi:MAG: hypothetical protein ABFD75_12910 [Smithella sp.]